MIIMVNALSLELHIDKVYVPFPGVISRFFGCFFYAVIGLYFSLATIFCGRQFNGNDSFIDVVVSVLSFL